MFTESAKLSVLSKRCLAVFILVSMAVCSADAARGKAWTDPAKAVKEDPDFSIQGEYGSAKPGGEHHCTGPRG